MLFYPWSHWREDWERSFYGFVLPCTLFCLVDNAEARWIVRMLRFCQAEHGCGEVIFASCCDVHELPGKQIQRDLSSLSSVWLPVL